MSANRKVVLFIAASMDGYIAAPNDDLSFLSLVNKEGEDYGYASFIQTVDTVIVGRKTYDWVMANVPEFSHADKTTYIITRSSKPSIGNTTFYSGNLKDLIAELKGKKGKNIFCDGGSEIIQELLKEKLIDEMTVSIIPILLGDGTRLFKDGRPEQKLKLVSTKQFDTGLTQLHYLLE
ncbi:MAG: dihydrofolate reductase [Sporocytophaga sp.]|uniref:dihydrofolate reductase family protein n=1 Tax=Sporocytophaga sp. TaxID=2231183 RepID=UPI001B2AC5F2|nr:dihydrofolate reductase family protein [Sporocytophaga sp.]MBO9703364.1 dihydrofolate reductase [Sporocytophaga sp.]